MPVLTNEHERIAREKKVGALVRLLIFRHVSAEAVAKFKQRDWAVLALDGNVRFPSAESRSQVIERMRNLTAPDDWDDGTPEIESDPKWDDRKEAL